MHNLPVHWSEGLFLRPHHFQAADRYWTEALQTSEQWDHQYNYGIRRLELSREAIANYQFQVNACHARMKDGTLVAAGPGPGAGPAGPEGGLRQGVGGAGLSWPCRS